MTKSIQQRVTQASDYLKEQLTLKPEVAIVLGSGLSLIADEIQDPLVIPYKEIPGFPLSTAPGHKGNLVVGKLAGRNVLLMQGRFHGYEGYSAQETSIPIQVFAELGVTDLLLTCATGGLNRNQEAGDIMAITDHINFSASNPFIGPNDDQIGPRFPVMFDIYHPPYIELAQKMAVELGEKQFHKGVYCGIQGPVFCTKAELRMFMLWGADSVGMSIVNEVMTAAHRGLKVLALGLISDIAIPDYGHHDDSDTILRRANESAQRVSQLIQKILPQLKA